MLLTDVTPYAASWRHANRCSMHVTSFFTNKRYEANLTEIFRSRNRSSPTIGGRSWGWGRQVRTWSTSMRCRWRVYRWVSFRLCLSLKFDIIFILKNKMSEKLFVSINLFYSFSVLNARTNELKKVMGKERILTEFGVFSIWSRLGDTSSIMSDEIKTNDLPTWPYYAWPNILLQMKTQNNRNSFPLLIHSSTFLHCRCSQSVVRVTFPDGISK